MEKINKIISFSDIHLKPLKDHEAHKLVYNKVIGKIKAEKPQRVVIAGDIFHNKLVVSNEMYIVIAKLLTAISKHTKIVIIPGNHDTVIGSTRVDCISVLVEMLDDPNIVYYKESGCYKDQWDGDIVWCAWSCLEYQKSPKIEEFKQTFSKEELNKLTFVGLYHGVIVGSTTDTGFSLGDEGIDPNDFYETDFFIAGDIHKHQTYNYPNYKGQTGFGMMCSSLIQQNFGETVENHGIILLEKVYGEWEFNLVPIENEYTYQTLQLTDFEELEQL